MYRKRSLLHLVLPRSKTMLSFFYTQIYLGSVNAICILSFQKKGQIVASILTACVTKKRGSMHGTSGHGAGALLAVQARSGEQGSPVDLAVIKVTSPRLRLRTKDRAQQPYRTGRALKQRLSLSVRGRNSTFISQKLRGYIEKSL